MLKQAGQLLLAFAALTAIFLAISSGVPPVVICSAQQQVERGDEANRPYTKVNCEKTDGVIYLATRRIASFIIDHLKDILEVLSLVVTAAATVAVARYTKTLWATSKAELAHSDEVERAYISGGGVRAFDRVIAVASQFDPSARQVILRPTGEFEFHANNYGKTSGTVYRLGFAFCDEGDAPPAPRYAFRPLNSPIGPGQSGIALARIPINPITAAQVVYGRFYYRTIFGTAHSSGFIYRIPLGGASESILRDPSYTREQNHPEDNERRAGLSRPTERFAPLSH